MTMQVVAYIRANKKGEPQWSEDCVCQDPVYPSDLDGSDSDCVSMALVREADALAAIKAARVQALRDAAIRAVIHSQYPIETDYDRGYDKARKDAAAAIRLLGEDAGRGES